jgi:predicted HTH transcriptional regulator
MPLPPFPSDEELLVMDVFPYMEGNQYEFKQTFSRLHPNQYPPESASFGIQEPTSPKTFDRIEQTICGFLNVNGGYIVCGIRDKTRELVWLNLSGEDMDKVLLRIDNIYHSKSIFTTDLEDLKIGNIRTKVLKHPITEKYLIIITVEPTPGKEYRTHEGKWTRLNASNYAEKQEKFFRAKDVSGLLHVERLKMIAKYDYSFQKKDQEIRRLRSELNLEREETEHMLTRTILTRKKIVEEELENKRHLYGFSFNFHLNLKCLLDCFVSRGN